VVLILCAMFCKAQSVMSSQRFVFVGDAKAGNNATRKISITPSTSSSTVKIIASKPYLISTDSINFDTLKILPASQTGVLQNLFIRLAPSIDKQIYQSAIKFIYNTIDTLTEHISLVGSSYQADSFYKVMSWNMLWFGSGSCSCDTSNQRKQAEFIVKEISPNLGAYQEVTWPNNFRLFASHVGKQYVHRLATYCSQAKDTIDANWDNNQKTAYLIDTTVFNPLPDHGFASANFANTTSISEYWAFASGRVPQILPLIDKKFADTSWYFNIHAKALSDLASYQRRQNGAYYLTDSLNQYYKNRKVALVGDYNDFLEGSILSGYSTPYKYMLDNAMTGISMPADYPGVQTYAFGTGIIDNLSVNERMKNRYAAKSYTVLSELFTAVDNYATAISDHYPILFYMKRATEEPIINTAVQENVVHNFTVQQSANALEVSCGGTCGHFETKIFNLQGALVHCVKSTQSAIINIETSQWPNGIYIVQITNGKQGLSNTKIVLSR
jgi:Secretion system C-terminal sorting domain